MSIFSRLFGRKKEQKAASFKNKSPVSHVPSTMQKFYDTEALLTKRQEYLEMKMATELQTAKQYGTQNKRLALQALRRRKQYEKQLLQIDGSLNTLQQQKLALENASMNAEVLKTLVTTSKALKTAQKGAEIEKVHDLMEEISEQHSVLDEISDAISNPFGLQMDDEEDLLAELEQLQKEDLVKKSHVLVKLPDVPSHSLYNTGEDNVLKELRNWGNL